METNNLLRRLSFFLRLRTRNAGHIRAAKSDCWCGPTENADRAISIKKMSGMATIVLLLGQSIPIQAQCTCPANSAPGAPMPISSLGTTEDRPLIDTDDFPACFLRRNPTNFTVFTACESWGKKENEGARGGLPAALSRTRGKFWETYPDKPGAKEAGREFAEALFLKDLLYLKAALVSGKQRDARDNPVDFIRMVNGGGLLGLGGSPIVDGGINEDLAPEFYDWAMRVRENYGQPRSPESFFKEGFEVGTIGPDLQKAIEASRPKYQKYVVERNWAEYRAKNRAPAEFEGNYGALLYLREARLKPAEAKFAYSCAAMVLGSNVAAQAAKRVQDAPKEANGNLVQSVRRGPVDDSTPMPQGVIGVYSNQLVAFERLMTLDDDRRYLMGLLTHLNRDDKGVFVGATKWCFADSMYKRYTWAFGEEAVRRAAHTVRVAQKRLTDGWVMDPKAIGSTRMEPYPAFEEVLVRNEPLGYVKSMLEFGDDLDSPKKLETAFEKLSAEHGQKAVLDAASKMAAGRPNPTTKEDLQKLLGLLGEDVPASEPAPRPLSKTTQSAPPRPLPARSLALQQRYTSVANRAVRVKTGFDLSESRLRTEGRIIPPEVRGARVRIDPEIKAYLGAMNRSDADQAEQSLDSLDADTTTIEKFLHIK